MVDLSCWKPIDILSKSQKQGNLLLTMDIFWTSGIYRQYYEDWFETADKILWTSACAHREGIILCECAKKNIKIMRCFAFLPFGVFLPLVSPSYQVILFNEIMQASVTFSSFDWWYLRGLSHVIGLLSYLIFSYGWWCTWLLCMVGGTPNYHDPR